MTLPILVAGRLPGYVHSRTLVKITFLPNYLDIFKDSYGTPHLNWGDCQVPEERAHPEMGILLEITY